METWCSFHFVTSLLVPPKSSSPSMPSTDPTLNHKSQNWRRRIGKMEMEINGCYGNVMQFRSSQLALMQLWIWRMMMDGQITEACKQESSLGKIYLSLMWKSIKNSRILPIFFLGGGGEADIVYDKICIP